MTALALLQYVADALYVVVFLVSAARFVRRQRTADLDITLLFGATTVIVALSLITSAIPAQLLPLVGVFTSILLMAIPYLLLRLVEDFAGSPLLVIRLTEIGLALSVVSLIVIPMPYPFWVVGPLVLYFLVVVMDGAWAFIQA